MKKIFGHKKNAIIFILYLFINALFIFKYTLRTEFSPILLVSFYLIFLVLCLLLMTKLNNRLAEKHYKYFTYIFYSLTVLGIGFVLYKVDPLSVRVDRWSAVTYFIDAVFHSEYPYAAHTHVSSTNFPSPFPIWYIINLPFYLMGDVGFGLFFFLSLFIYTIKSVSGTYKNVFFALIFLILSPAYWWEVYVRSDSLSNGFLVFAILLLTYKKRYTLESNLIIMILVCGIVACTRMSAILPVFLFLFKPYLNSSNKIKVLFPIGILCFVLISFVPFIFWDTKTWIFFDRNPFMSQSSIGNIYVLILMIILGLYFSLKWKNISEYSYYTGIFIFIFIAASQLTLVLIDINSFSLANDSNVDISYFTLAFPYLIHYQSNVFNTSIKAIKTQ